MEGGEGADPVGWSEKAVKGGDGPRRELIGGPTVISWMNTGFTNQHRRIGVTSEEEVGFSSRSAMESARADRRAPFQDYRPAPRTS